MIRAIALAGLLLLGGCFGVFSYGDKSADGSSTEACFVCLQAPGQAGFMAGAEAATEAVRAATERRDQAAADLATAEAEEASVDAQIATVVSYTDTINKLDAAIVANTIVDPDKSQIQDIVRVARTARISMRDADDKRNIESANRFRSELDAQLTLLKGYVDKYNL